VTAQTDTLSPFQQAVAAAQAEIDGRQEDDPSEAEAVEPLASGQEDEIEVEADEDQASSDDEEQAQEVLEPSAVDDDEETDEIFDGLEIEDEPAEEAGDTLYDLPGQDEPVSLQQLKDGFLRNDHYTQGRQELAREREQLAKAEQLYKALTEHPKELAAQLAVAAGLIEAGAQPLKVVDLPFRSDDEYQADVQKAVDEALAEHPDIVEARDLLVQQWIETEFTRIEEKAGQKLGPKSRELILKEAVAKGVDDLEMVFNDLMARQGAKARNTEKLKRTAPVKPTGKASTSTVTAEAETFVDAAALAAEKLGIELDLTKLNN
jgi:hypothetical protein